MHVIVPTPTPDCPAHRALQIEGVDHDEIVCATPTTYGSLLTELWDAGEPFVLVEWDIVPWPGALDALEVCEQPWCGYPYPIVGEGSVIASLGCTKITPVGSAPDALASTQWPIVDCAIGLRLADLHGEMHLHEPLVAHLATRHFEGGRS